MVRDCVSSMFYNEQSVPQGSPLSATMDIVAILITKKNHFNRSLLVFVADDTVLISYNCSIVKHARHAVKPEYIELSQSTLIWNNKLTEVAMLVLSKKICQKLGEKLLTMAMKNKL